jgi:kumamolisin
VQQMGQKPPDLVDRSAGSPVRSFGSDEVFDKELALDIQVLAGVLPEARIVVYFASDLRSRFPAALDTVLRDDSNRPSVLSISWGTAEEFWEDDVRLETQRLLRAAAAANITVVAASGDGLANAGQPGSGPTVWFPASSPDVLCCGGTMIALSADGQRIASEEVWNERFVGTGGGISQRFPVPSYQQQVRLPPDAAGGIPGRGVPDVAAVAASSPGYRIVLGGKETTASGTSAATPFWAALIALANAQRGRPLAGPHSYMYAHRELFREILQGDNRAANGLGYDAGPDWNACTGLGVPRAADVIAGLALMPEQAR